MTQPPPQGQPQPTILSSPFLTAGVLDTALSSAESADPAVRVQLLGAKVHLLERGASAASVAVESAASKPGAASTPTSATSGAAGAGSSTSASPGTSAAAAAAAARPRRSRADPTALLNSRILLADAYLALVPPNLHAAEGECMAVEGECKALMRVAKRLDRRREAGARTEPKDGEARAGEGEAEEEERPDWLDDIPRLRTRALRVLARVEEGLGRGGRAERTRKLADDLVKR